MLSEGLKHGHGKYYYLNGNTYEGDWQNDKKHGKGRYVYYSTDEYYDGDWREGERHGKGEAGYAYGDVYVGDFKKNERDIIEIINAHLRRTN